MTLERKPVAYGDLRGWIDALRAAGELHAKLHFGTADDIIRFGLHEYLMEFLDSISELGSEINTHFLVPG